jgi:hypothetical protein
MQDERVILIRGDRSKWYDQAIFIMKKNTGKTVPVDLITEAEKIIGQYIYKTAYTPPHPAKPGHALLKKNKSVDILINALALLSCTILVIVLLVYFQ